MMARLFPVLFASLAFSLLSCTHDSPLVGQNQPPQIAQVNKIAFGSCGHEDKDQPVLTTAAAENPDIFIFMGDNIYGDTKNMNTLRKKYDKLAAKPEFIALREQCTVLATWDDHDYGQNDAGKDYKKKAESKEVFLEFWKEPFQSERRNHPGIYTSYLFGEPGQRVQIILLDTRTFRTKLLPANGPEHRNDYRPNPGAAATMLGEKQWQWLEKQLQIPAEVRIIGTSTQFGISYNGYEAWANFPLEREKMLRLIRDTRANGVFFISGDVHYGELSLLDGGPGNYPLFDLTSSGITQTWGHVEENENRVGEAFQPNNYGLIEFDWNSSPPVISLSVKDVNGTAQIEQEIRLDELSW